MSDPCWYQHHREKSGLIPPDLHLLDAELDLFNGVPVDVVADLYLLPLHQLRPDNCKGTTRKTQMFTPLAFEVVLVEAGSGLICIRSECRLRLGWEEHACARYCKRFIRGRNASCFLLGRKPVSKALKKRNSNFPPVRRGLSVSLSEASTPSWPLKLQLPEKEKEEQNNSSNGKIYAEPNRWATESNSAHSSEKTWLSAFTVMWIQPLHWSQASWSRIHGIKVYTLAFLLKASF